MRRGVSVSAGGRDHLHFGCSTRESLSGSSCWGIMLLRAFGALALVSPPRPYKLVALIVLGILVLIVLWQTERHSQ